MFKKLIVLILLFYPITSLAVLIPNDPLFYRQDYLKKVNAQKAWDFSDGSGVVIAFLDSRIDINHPDLIQNIWTNIDEVPGDGIDNDSNGFIDDIHGWDFVSGGNNPNPSFRDDCLEEGLCNEIGINHGTILAGIAAASGESKQGIIGLAYKAKIMPIRVLDDNGVGNIRSVIDGINYAVNNKVDIINLSLVGSYKSGALERVLKKAYKNGIVIVAASGNDVSESNGVNLDENPLYPVCEIQENNFIIGVGALDKFGEKLDASNYGSNCIDISTVGENFYSTLFYSPNNKNFLEGYGGSWSGTSVATALVSGAAALVKSANQNLSSNEIKNALTQNVNDFSNLETKFINKMGSGELDAFRAVRAVAKNVKNVHKEPELSKKYLITSFSESNSSAVKIFNLTDNFFVKDFNVGNKELKEKVNLSSGDVVGGNKNEIIIGAGSGEKSYVKIFDDLGRLKSDFFAYDKNFRGGVQVTTGDIDNDGIDEIITGAGVGGGPHVRIFDKNGNLKSDFFAYDKNFRGGVNIVVADINNNKKSEIIVSPQTGKETIKIFNSLGEIMNKFILSKNNFQKGINIAIIEVK